MKPPQIVALSFLAAILIGTALLCLPCATASGKPTPLIDALFTATSATCVTGLIVRDTATYFSRFGKIVIMLLIQIGGLGIMTFSTAFAVLLGRRLTIKENIVIQSALDHHKIEGLPKLIKYILLLTFSLELIGAACLFIRWHYATNWSVPETWAKAVFHSISAFCNAGFSLFSSNLADFRGDVYVNLIMMGLIFLGGIGFVVIMDFPKFKFWRRDKHIWFSKISLQAKLVLLVSLILIFVGALLLFLLEYNGSFRDFTFKEKILSSFFQSVTPRTAGFNTVAIPKLCSASQLLLVLLMFIGASPGGTGGGIKTSSFGILIAAAWAMLRNKEEVSLFKKTVPKSVFYKAFVVFVLALGWIFIFTATVVFIEKDNLGLADRLLSVLFEVASAFGTVGLSMGITPALSALSKFLISMTMFLGRVGPLTLALALAVGKEKASFKYPEERIMIG